MPQQTQPDIDMVLEALADNVNYPEGPAQVVREMLCNGLPYAIGVPHEFQQKLVDMAASVLDEAQKAAAAAISSSSAQAQAEQAKSQIMEEMLGAVKQEIGTASQQVEAFAEALREAEVKASDANGVHTEAQEAKQTMVEKRSQLEAQKLEMDDIAEALRQYEEGQVAEVPSARVLDFLESAGAEKALLAAAPAALRCKVTTRTGFDTFVVTEITGFVTRNATKLAAELEAGADEADCIRAEALGAWALRDVVKERKAEATIALGEGQEALKKAEAQIKAAEADFKHQQDVISTCKVQQTFEENRLKKLESAAAALRRLAEAPVPGSEEEHTQEADAEMAVEAPEQAEADMEVDEGAEVHTDASEKIVKLKEDSLKDDLKRIPTPMTA